MVDVVSNDLKDNSKWFWSFVKSKRQESTGVAPLINKDRYFQSYPTKKAEILSQQFQSVYTKEDPNNIPDKRPSPYSSMADITVNPNGVKKLLKELRPYKSSGPDRIPTFILRGAADELAPMLSVIYQRSLDDGCVPQTGLRLSLFPSTRKDINNSHLTTNFLPHLSGLQGVRAYCAQQKYATF